VVYYDATMFLSKYTELFFWLLFCRKFQYNWTTICWPSDNGFIGKFAQKIREQNNDIR
jgi:hypothetical protein